MSTPSILKLPPIPPGTDPQTAAIIKALVDSIIQLEKKLNDHEARLAAGGH